MSSLNQLASLFDAEGAKTVELEPGDVLMNEGDAAGSVYLLMDGILQVSRNFDGDEAVLATIDQPGSLVGEMVALGGGTRTATVTALAATSLVGITDEEFHAALDGNDDLARELVSVAVRRAEEGELAEILASHFGIVDEETLAFASGSVSWKTLVQGEALVTEGDRSDAMYFVVRGRVVASRYDPVNDETVIVGESGRGEAVGEIGLLANTPRTATVSAARDTVVAELSEAVFLSLVERQPRMAIDLCLRAIARATENRLHSAATNVLAVVGAGVPEISSITAWIVETLSEFGTVSHLSPELVDGTLGLPGISQTPRNEIGDIRVSRMVHELELEADHLVVSLGGNPGPWTRRALGMADRVLILVPADMTETQAQEVDSLLGGCPTAVARTLVIVQPSASVVPSGSTQVKERFGAESVIQVVGSSKADVARLARISVGRGNALILGGGGGRGFAHIGVFRALTEFGFPIDIVGGTSIGAVMGTVIADAKSSDEITRWAATHFPRVLDYTLPVVSLIKGNRIARAATDTFADRDVEDLWRTYFAISADLTSSRTHVHDSGSVALAIRATSAIPGVMPPVPYGEALLIDGGVLNNLPIDVARSITPRGKVVAVDVAPPRGPGAHGDYGLSVSGWAALRSSFGSDRSPYPRISAVLMRSMITASMQERDRQVQDDLADCYLDLDIRGVSMLDFDDPATVAQQGYEAATPALERWLSAN